MSGRGQRAALPPEPHHRPVPRPHDGLKVEHRDRKGRVGTFNFDEIPVGPELQRAFARWFAEKCAPGGGWDSLPSSKAMWFRLTAFGRFCAEQENPPQRLVDITPALWNRWRMRRPEGIYGYSQVIGLGGILTAVQRKEEILARSKKTPNTPDGQAALEDYLGRFIAAGTSLPSMAAGNKSGLAATYISFVTGASIRQVHHQVIAGRWRERLLSADGPAPVLTELSGTVDGRPWKKFIDYSEVGTLKTHLTTAAYIVVSYLTGMRPREIQGLERGCCPEPESGRYLIYGRVYKTAVNEDGNHVPQGTMRDVPWVAIEPVVRGIRTAERINPDGYLFGGLPPDIMNLRVE